MRALLARQKRSIDHALALVRLQMKGSGSAMETSCYSGSVPSSLTIRASSSATPSNQRAPQTATPPQSDASSPLEKARGPLSQIPTMPKVLGLGGLLPFIALSAPVAGSIPLVSPDFAANAAILQVGYGATIASFLGGIHWSLAMVNYGNATVKANSDRYLWSVIPCLAAWPALAMETGPGSLVVAATLVGAFFADRAFSRKGLLPSWYMGLRLPLTVVASFSLLLTCAYSFTATAQKRSRS